MATIGPDPRSGPPGYRLAVDGPASHSAPVRWLLAHDPELDALTKAAKLAVVTCVALWLSVAVIGAPAVGGLDGLAPAPAHELAYTTAGVGETAAGIAAADGRSLIDRVLGRHRPDARQAVSRWAWSVPGWSSSAWAVRLDLDDAARLEEPVTPALVRLTTTREQHS